MRIKNNENAYGIVAIVFHWLMAVAVIAMFALGLWMDSLDYYDAWYKQAPHIHKSIGILLVCVWILRLSWRQFNIKPGPLVTHTPFERRAAKWTHRILYLLLILLMFSGYMISTADGRAIDVFNWFAVPASGLQIDNQEDIAGEIHEILAWLVIIVASVHAAAALKHHFFDKDATLRRILRISK